jgi:hypothetical protein
MAAEEEATLDEDIAGVEEAALDEEDAGWDEATEGDDEPATDDTAEGVDDVPWNADEVELMTTPTDKDAKADEPEVTAEETRFPHFPKPFWQPSPQ